MIALDAMWCAAHPLPAHGEATDKNARGRVLLIGGSAFVPGALRLTAEAALRAGAGKLQMATVESAAMPLGVLVPEAAMIGLPADNQGEITADAADAVLDLLDRCDALVIGPGMSEQANARGLLKQLLMQPMNGATIILDAAAATCAGALQPLIVGYAGEIIFTPHHGEMAALMDVTKEAVAEDPHGIAREAAKRFGAVVVLKAADTVIATPDGEMFVYSSDCVGLATGGSGDVLAGLIGGLAARGAPAVVAAAWGVWLHGRAGQAAAERIGPIGFLARDLVEQVPRLMAAASCPDGAAPGDGQLASVIHTGA